jgi:hypothetical protein
MTKLPIFVIHYSPLKERRDYLVNKLPHFTEWITENSILPEIKRNFEQGKVFGVSERIVGMDLGVTARSLIKSRKKARFEGYLLFLMSFLGPTNNKYTTGSLPVNSTLPKSQLELQKMHYAAILKGLELNQPWILILEDDSILTSNALNRLGDMLENLPKTKSIWINLNSGAGLKRTKSDNKPDSNGLYEVVPPSTRCTTSYIINSKFATNFKVLVEKYGMPDWLPIDYVFNVALRKTKSKAFWQDPPFILQGSETGAYRSNLRVNAYKDRDELNYL